MKSLSFRELRRELVPKLRREGVSERDAKMATTLVSLIRWFDARIFGPHDIAPVLLSRQRLNLLAAYQCLPDGSASRYVVFTHNITQSVVRDARASQFFICRTSGELRIFPSSASVPEYLIAIAAHEVRHRLQQSGVIRKMFSRIEQSGASDRLLRLLWNTGKARHQNRIKRLFDAGRDARLIANETSKEEFDARLVEQMVMHRYHACETDDELVNLVLIEPETVECRA